MEEIEQKIEEVLSAFPLDEIPGDISNSEWWKCLCAIKHSCRTGYGRDLALEWSQNGSKFDQFDFDEAWASIDENYKYKKPTIGTIIFIRKQYLSSKKFSWQKRGSSSREGVLHIRDGSEIISERRSRD